MAVLRARWHGQVTSAQELLSTPVKSYWTSGTGHSTASLQVPLPYPALWSRHLNRRPSLLIPVARPGKPGHFHATQSHIRPSFWQGSATEHTQADQLLATASALHPSSPAASQNLTSNLDLHAAAAWSGQESISVSTRNASCSRSASDRRSTANCPCRPRLEHHLDLASLPIDTTGPHPARFPSVGPSSPGPWPFPSDAHRFIIAPIATGQLSSFHRSAAERCRFDRLDRRS